MKLTLIIMIVSLMQVSAATFGQNVTLKESRMPLEKVFKEIRKQTGYDIFLSAKQVKLSTVVNVDFTNTPLKNVIDKVLSGLPLTYTIDQKTIVIKEVEKSLIDKVADYLASIDVSGKVVDKEGKPLAGANIKVKGTNIMTSANDNGEFTLKNIDEKAVLEISFVGFKTIEVKAAKELGNISLEILTGDLDLVEVVNTGYQTLDKTRTTGSFTVIEGKDLNMVVGSNVIDKLLYMTSGMTKLPSNVSPDGILTIRGLSTYSTNIAKPLIILDNFEYQGDINNINPNDIENITILKDAAAGSIWGAKAGNGVIVITTKKGKFNQELTVSANVNTTIIDKPDLFTIKQMSSSDFIDVEKLLFQNEYRLADTLYPMYYRFSPVYEILIKQKNGVITQSQANDQINGMRGNDVRNEYNKYFYNKAINQQYSVSLNGGSGNFAWKMSSGLDHNKDQNSNIERRLNVNFNSTIKLSEKLEFSNSIYFTNTHKSRGKPTYGSILTSNGLPPYTKFADENGKAIPLYLQYRQGFIDTLGGGRLLNWNYYPLEDYLHTQNNLDLLEYNATIGMKYKILKGFDLNLLYRAQKQTVDQKSDNDINSYYSRNLINTFTLIDPSSGNISYRVPKGGILQQSSTNINSQNFRAQFNLNKSFGKHIISLLAGSEVNETKTSNDEHITYGYDKDILSYTNVDFANQHYVSWFGNYYNIPSGLNFTGTNIRFLSFYSNAGYSYDNRYSASFSIRTDASNTFGVKTNDKFEPQYSMGLAWNIASESFYHFDEMSVLKLRATYGIQGNVDPSKVALTTLRYDGVNNQFTKQPSGSIYTFANPLLKWEKVAITNFGLDFATKSSRISGSFEVYRKKSTDLYGSSYVDPTVGQNKVAVRNIGTMYVKGFDLLLNTLNVNKQIRWQSSISVSYSTDKLGKVDVQETSAQNIVSGVAGNLEGYPVFRYFAFKSAGLDPLNGNPRGILNGKVTSNYDSLINYTPISELKYIGRLSPSYYGYLTNTVSYKNFSLIASLNYKFGYYFRKTSINYNSLIFSAVGHSDYEKRWQSKGDELKTTVPSFVYPVNGLRDMFYTNSDVLATKGDHIRLQYITLNYSFNNLKSKVLPFKNLTVYTSINNVGIIWRANKDGIDPENINGPTYPRSYSIGLSAIF